MSQAGTEGLRMRQLTTQAHFPPRDGLIGWTHWKPSHCGALVDIQTEVCCVASREERLIFVVLPSVCPRYKDDLEDRCPAMILEASKGVPWEESVTGSHRLRDYPAGRATSGKVQAAPTLGDWKQCSGWT